MSLIEWAMRWNIPPEALNELCTAAVYTNSAPEGESEERIKSLVRINAAQQGKFLYRNNVGAGKLQNGSFIRWGLANDSSALNEKFKSGDLIGWERIVITPDMVGQSIARFLSVECKRGDWKFSGNKEEVAQVAWATLVNSQGGRAIITNDPSRI